MPSGRSTMMARVSLEVSFTSAMCLACPDSTRPRTHLCPSTRLAPTSFQASPTRCGHLGQLIGPAPKAPLIPQGESF
jgi:hypothetical protein